MPPRGRSSGSRSSSRSSSSRSRSSSSSRSRSSSSRSSSSRSSSRSYSSGSRSSNFSSSSRPSSRSTRSSTSHSSSFSYNPPTHPMSRPTRRVEKQRPITDRKAAIFAKNYKKPIRTKPTFVIVNTKVKPTFHHCYKHDYYYYDTDFYDETTNVHYKKGYYDENGEYYEDLNLKYSETEVIELVECEYCGSQEKIDLKNAETGETFKCSNCNALLDLDNITELNTDFYVCDEDGNFTNEKFETYYVDEPYSTSTNPYSSGTRVEGTGSSKVNSIFAIIIVLFLSTCCFLPCVSSMFDSTIETFDDVAYNNESVSRHEYDYYDDYYNDDYEYDSDFDNETYYDYELFGDELYVPEIGRTCYYDINDGYYYDSESNCYFYYNNDVTPGQMTYWFEDFSSNYGDYGWLEYDENDGNWYVEVDYAEWEVVEDVPNYFWHTFFDSLLEANNVTETTMLETTKELPNTIYVSEIGRMCSLNGQDYYDYDTDCYFYVDYNADTPTILYWYEDFSSDYGDYGWLEYDEYEDNWYVEVDYGEWEVVYNVPDYFWHTDYETLLNDN